jgi:hypothetical protein
LKSLQPLSEVRRKIRSSNSNQLTGSQIREYEVSLRKDGDFVFCFDMTTQVLKMPSEDVRQSLGSASQNWPSTRVAGGHQDKRDGRRG